MDAISKDVGKETQVSLSDGDGNGAVPGEEIKGLLFLC